MIETISIPEIDIHRDPTLIRICESGEKLAKLSSTGRIWVAPAYYALGFTTSVNAIYLRTGALQALKQAAASLPDGFSILVWDGLRTLKTQREIAECFQRSLTQLVPDAKQRDLIVRQYVSPIPLSELEYYRRPPPHATGGAVGNRAWGRTSARY